MLKSCAPFLLDQRAVEVEGGVNAPLFQRCFATMLPGATRAARAPVACGTRWPRAAGGTRCTRTRFRFRYRDERGPQHAFRDHVTLLEDLDDGAGRLVRVELAHRLVAVRVELLALRVDVDDLRLLERGSQVLECQVDTHLDLVDRRRLVGERHLERVLDRQQVRRKILDRELVGVGDIGLRATAHVLGVGQRAQELVARLRCLVARRFEATGDVHRAAVGRGQIERRTAFVGAFGQGIQVLRVRIGHGSGFAKETEDLSIVGPIHDLSSRDRELFGPGRRAPGCSDRVRFFPKELLPDDSKRLT